MQKSEAKKQYCQILRCVLFDRSRKGRYNEEVPMVVRDLKHDKFAPERVLPMNCYLSNNILHRASP